jgi:hypothetical protein
MLTGGATGDTSGTITLTDSSFFNSFVQQFTPGDLLSFEVDLTANYVDPTPDQFSFAILNGSMFEVPTTAPGGQLLSVDLRPPLTFQFFAGDPNSTTGDPILHAPSTNAVPEPSSLLLMSTAGVAAIIARLRLRA